jgi:hypothetical protein
VLDADIASAGTRGGGGVVYAAGSGEARVNRRRVQIV